MMIRFLLPVFLIMLAFPARPQLRVLESAEIPREIRFSFMPDAEGKVLVAGDLSALALSFMDDDTLQVWPGWPIQVNGENERGGIFCNLDEDSLLEVVYSSGLFTYAFKIDGSALAGWPKQLDFPADGAPAFGDIDGDSIGEIVVTTHKPGSANEGSIYAWEGDGSSVAGFPVILEGGAIKTPALADLDGDGALEIVLSVRNWPEGFVYVYRGDGSPFPNWPQRMDYTPGSAVAVGDINDDDIPEIIVESYYSLNVYNTQGVVVEGFPFTPGDDRVFSFSTPVLADLDDDGHREIIFGDHSLSLGDGQVYVLRSDGTAFPGWPKVTGYWIYGPPSIGDIDGDGILDIAIGDQVLSASPLNKVYAWNSLSGEALDGFPVTGLNSINNQIILADLDGDTAIELMFDDNTSANVYLGYNDDGSPMDGWPLPVNGISMFINPCVTDLNYDGILDISGGGYAVTGSITSLYLWNAGVPYNPLQAILPVLQYNTRHNGVYGDYLMVGVDENSIVPSSERLRIWPNPAQAGINIVLPGSRTGLLSITDLAGRQIASEKVDNKSTSRQDAIIDLGHHKPGLYIVRFLTDKVQYTGKVMVIPAR